MWGLQRLSTYNLVPYVGLKRLPMCRDQVECLHGKSEERVVRALKTQADIFEISKPSRDPDPTLTCPDSNLT